MDIQEKLKMLPEQSGVYIMRNKQGEIIYIGKAKVLKNRVRQYFHDSAAHSTRIAKMVSQIDDFETIITNSELEALLLECTLIKEHQPRYNVLLKDDKGYPFIKLTNEPYPRLLVTHSLDKDGGRYFGPYPSGFLAKKIVEMNKSLFGLSWCNKKWHKPQKRACLYYHMKRCAGPCTGNVSVEEYALLTKQVVEFIEGNHAKLIQQLETDMQLASENLEFEKAASIRDKILAIKQICEKQLVYSAKGRNMDVFAVAHENGLWVFELFFIRQGKLLGRGSHKLENFLEFTECEALDSFLSQYYENAKFIPSVILLPFYTENVSSLCAMLSDKAGFKVKISVPKRGELRRYVELAQANADKSLRENIIQALSQENRANALSLLGEALELAEPPNIIEAYDISHISGENSVAGMVVFEDGRPKKSLYKRFKIKYVEGVDDCASIYETVLRRLARYKDNSRGFDYLPDLMLIDGGKAQLNAAKQALESVDLDIPVFGMVKDDDHKTEGIIAEKGEVHLKKISAPFRLLTHIQDEVHRYSLEYHKKLRKSSMLMSELDSIKGVGEKRKQALRVAFSNIEQIKKADMAELLAVKGVDKSTAENIYKHFNP